MLSITKHILTASLLMQIVFFGSTMADRFSEIREAFDLDLPEDESFWGRELQESMSIPAPDPTDEPITPTMEPPSPTDTPVTPTMEPVSPTNAPVTPTMEPPSSPTEAPPTANPPMNPVPAPTPRPPPPPPPPTNPAPAPTPGANNPLPFICGGVCTPMGDLCTFGPACCCNMQGCQAVDIFGTSICN